MTPPTTHEAAVKVVALAEDERHLLERLRALAADGVFLIAITRVRGRFLNVAILSGAKRETL